MKFHKTTIMHLKKRSLAMFITKQNSIAKLSQKETRFFKNVLYKGLTTLEHCLPFITAMF